MASKGNVTAARNPFRGWRFLHCPRPGTSRLNKAAITGPLHPDFESTCDCGVVLGGLILGSRFSALSFCNPSLPMPVKREAGENQEEADGGAAGALEPDIESESKRAGDEEAGDPGVAPAAIGARQIGFGLAHAKEGDNGGGVEDPGSKNKEIGQLFECSRQRHQTCQYALKEQRAPGPSEFRMDAPDDLEKKSIAGHGVAYARSAENGGVHRTQRGDDHGEGDPTGGGGPFDVCYTIAGNVL